MYHFSLSDILIILTFMYLMKICLVFNNWSVHSFIDVISHANAWAEVVCFIYSLTCEFENWVKWNYLKKYLTYFIEEWDVDFLDLKHSRISWMYEGLWAYTNIHFVSSSFQKLEVSNTWNTFWNSKRRLQQKLKIWNLPFSGRG